MNKKKPIDKLSFKIKNRYGITYWKGNRLIKIEK
jgi:hypothetical protein